MELIYFNNAATSHPKPHPVYEAVLSTLTSVPSEPGRSTSAKDPAAECRGVLSDFFDVPDTKQVVLSPSCTHAVNTVIAGIGMSSSGRRMITSRIEHNAVLRPLMQRNERDGTEIVMIPTNADGIVDVSRLSSKILSDSDLICISHASNVTGVIQPIEKIATIAADAGTPLLIDAAQTAGCVPISYRKLPGKVYLAFAGHKNLFGPSGIGGLIVPDDTLAQSVVGGTGIQSESLTHPLTLPLRHEAGTPNLPGIAGLCAGVRYILENGIENLGKMRSRLVSSIRGGFESVEGVSLYPAACVDRSAGIVSFGIRNRHPEEVGFVLKEVFGIETRAGLHCAPLIHAEPGMNPVGTVRIGVSPFNTQEDVDRLVAAVTAIAVG